MGSSGHAEGDEAKGKTEPGQVWEEKDQWPHGEGDSTVEI